MEQVAVQREGVSALRRETLQQITIVTHPDGGVTDAVIHQHCDGTLEVNVNASRSNRIDVGTTGETDEIVLVGGR